MKIAAILLAGAAVATALPQRQERSVVESRPFATQGWKRAEFPDAEFQNKRLPLKIALAQSNLDTIADELHRVSDPASPDYGKHWSYEDIARHFAPSAESVDAVRGWLHDSGLHKDRQTISKTKQFIHVDASVDEVERLLDTKYYNMKHEDTGYEAPACEEYSVPSHIRPHIDFILPTLNFIPILSEHGLKKRRLADRATHISIHNTTSHALNSSDATVKVLQKFEKESKITDDPSKCNDQRITPSCLKTLYHVPGDFQIQEPSPSADSPAIGLIEFGYSPFSQKDLDSFTSQLAPSSHGYKPRAYGINYANTDFNAYGILGQVLSSGIEEADLDVQYAVALGGPLDVATYQLGDQILGGSFNTFLDAVDASYCGHDDPSLDGFYIKPDCNTVPPPKVLSISWGSAEAQQPKSYSERQCNEWAKLGLAGMSVLTASGDYGTSADGTCLNADGSEPDSIFNTKKKGRFMPDWPAACPYVTAVGATNVKPGVSIYDANPEEAIYDKAGWYSGGGFSDQFNYGDYQKGAMEAWLAKYKPGYPSGICNDNGKARGYPDVSANGLGEIVVYLEQNAAIGGTSASTPIVASFIAQINAHRLHAGKAPVGFVNPVLYSDQFKDAFTDITQGHNPACGEDGFESVPGWDPVTGLGTPLVDKWLDHWLSLP